MADIFGIGAAVAQGAANAIAGNAINKKQQERNYTYNEMAAENADQRTRGLYEDLYSPQAKMEQLRQAGLSASLMYGQSGAGVGGSSSTAGAQGSGADGMQAPQTRFDLLQGAMIDSQIQLNKAEADKTKAEADSIRGEEGTIGASEIARNLADAGAKKAAERLTEAQEVWQQLQNRIGEATEADKINEITWTAQRAMHQALEAYYKAEQEGVNLHITQETAEQVIAQAQAQLDNLLAQNELLKAQTQQVTTKILQDWVQLAIYNKSVNEQIEWVKQQIEQSKAEVQNIPIQNEITERNNKRSAYTSMISSILSTAITMGTMATFRYVPAGGKMNPIGFR